MQFETSQAQHPCAMMAVVVVAVAAAVLVTALFVPQSPRDLLLRLA